MINLEIREFSQAIINFVNQSPLAIEIKRLCINEIAVQLQSTADAQLYKELQDREDKQSERQEERDESEKDTSNDLVEK